MYHKRHFCFVSNFLGSFQDSGGGGNIDDIIRKNRPYRAQKSVIKYMSSGGGGNKLGKYSKNRLGRIGLQAVLRNRMENLCHPMVTNGENRNTRMIKNGEE